MSKTKKQRRIILNNSGYSLAPRARQTPIGVQGLIAEAITPLVGTHVDTLFWCLGADSMNIANISNVYCHDTKVGEKYGENWDTFPDSEWWRLYENFRDMLEKGHDPPRVIVEHGRKAGLEVFLSLRVNDIHDGVLPDSSKIWSTYKREHPELLLGEQPGCHKNFWTALNYGRPEVREHRLAIIREALELYDMDGFELDFMRMPLFFDVGMGYAYRHVMSDFVRRVRYDIEDAAKRRGHEIILGVRVPASFDTCEKIGLDVRAWLDDRLINLLTIGGGYRPFDYPYEEFAEAAHAGDCQLYATYNNIKREEVTRAWAQTAWKGGVDGLYVFNWGAYLSTDPQPLLSEIGDPDLIARKSKQYDFKSHTSSETLTGIYWVPPGPLPLTLDVTPADDELQVSLKVADDLEAAKADGTITEVILKIELSDLTPLDQLSFKLNGQQLDLNQAKYSRRLRMNWFEWCLNAPPVRQGENIINISVQQRSRVSRVPLMLRDVAIMPCYRNP